MPPFVEIKNLTKCFGDQLVIDRLSLDIEEGEIVVFKGPSGIGKSTFLRCLNYLEPFQEGTVQIGPIKVEANMDEKRDRLPILALRRQMGFVFQFFNLFPHLTVIENLSIGPIEVMQMPKAQAIEEGHRLLKRVGLAQKADAYPATLSGGQQQRVAIARALAMQPRVILFDEPTASLDPEMKNEIFQVVEEFRKDRLTMLIVTHEPEFVNRIATRVVTFREHCRVS